jgi:hypothetical protein
VDELVVVVFNNRVTHVVGPLSVPLDAELVDMVCKEDLVPADGTNVELAMSEAMKHATRSLEEGKPSAIVLMTDGDDHDLKQRLDAFRHRSIRGASLFESLQRGISGLWVCTVGICHDADAYLLNKLAELAHGTYTITADEDIAGLLGSTVAMVQERVDDKVVVDVWAQAIPADENTPPSAMVAILTDHVVRLHRNPDEVVRLPFALDHDSVAWTITATVRVCRLGASDPPTDASSMSIVSVMPIADMGGRAPDVDCVIQDLERLCLETTTALTQALVRSDYDEAETLNTQAMAQLERLKLDFAVVLDKPAVVERVQRTLSQLVGRARDIEGARADFTMRRELSHRVCSDASTARNGGLSFGAGESDAQRDMRTRSASMSF